MPIYSIREPKVGASDAKARYRLSLDVSQKEWDDFDGQVKDAIAFLTKYRQSLKQLHSQYEISQAFLDFPMWSRLEGEIVNQNDFIPAELVGLCGEIGIGIAIALYSKDAFNK